MQLPSTNLGATPRSAFRFEVPLLGRLPHVCVQRHRGATAHAVRQVPRTAQSKPNTRAGKTLLSPQSTSEEPKPRTRGVTHHCPTQHVCGKEARPRWLGFLSKVMKGGHCYFTPLGDTKVPLFGFAHKNATLHGQLAFPFAPAVNTVQWPLLFDT